MKILYLFAAVLGAVAEAIVAHLPVRKLVVVVLVLHAVPAEGRAAGAAVELQGGDTREAAGQRHRIDVDLQVGDHRVVRLLLDLFAPPFELLRGVPQRRVETR